MKSIEDIIAAEIADEISKEMDQEVMFAVTKNWPDNARRDGWAGDYIVYDDSQRNYFDIVKWIKINIDNPEGNAHWIRHGRGTSVYIRRPADLTAFLLRWA